jgi:RecG-like helicase
MASLDSKLVNVVGDRTAKVLDSVFGYKTLSDLIHHYPRRYLVRGELSDIAELKEGDEVIVFGEDLAINLLAEKIDTIPYEILTSISQRVKRIYYYE